MRLNLFKYCPPKYNKSLNLPFFEKKALYFQQPYKLNDPWDCKTPYMDIPYDLQLLKKWHYHISQGRDRNLINSVWKKNSKLSKSEIIELYKNIFYSTFENQRQKMGVFSASFIPDNELLWAHYSESHNGYMLQLDIPISGLSNLQNLQNIGVPIPVIYRRKRQKWDLSTYLDKPNEHIYDLIRFKGKVWQYEYEMRLLSPDKSGFIEIPDSWIKSITVGLAAEKEIKDALIEIGKQINRPVYFASLDKFEYKIVIPGLEITRDEGIKNYQKTVSAYSQIKSPYDN